MRGKYMNEKAWNDFEKSGRVEDYLNYRLTNPGTLNSKVNRGKIKPALPCDVGIPEKKDGIEKLHLTMENNDYADKNKGYRP